MPTPRPTPASPRPDPIWDHLRELWPDLLILTSIAGVVWLFDAQLGHLGAGIVVGLLVSMLVGLGPLRRSVNRLWKKVRWRRRVLRALRFSERFAARRPWVRHVLPTLYGASVELRLRAGQDPSHVEQATEQLAATMRVRHVRVERQGSHAGRVSLALLRRDPFVGPPLFCPWASASTSPNLWLPLPIGIDESGREVGLLLPGHNLVVGGEPGSGKSNFLQLVCAATALDPGSQLNCLDPKLVELSRWREHCAAFADADLGAAIGVLAGIHAEMTARKVAFEAHGSRKIGPGSDYGLCVLVVDELAVYLTSRDRRVDEFTHLLRELISLGRALGIVVILATQKPTAQTLPSNIRDLITYRAAFRCTTRDASDTILGAGRAAAGYSAAEIAMTAQGTCWLLHERAVPQQVRTYYLDDDTLASLVARARGPRALDDR